MKFSYHVHSKYSDGKDSIEDIINYAEKLGLDEIGISDHFHIPIESSHYHGDMKISLLDTYVKEILSLKEKKQITVRLGLEVDFVPQTHHLLDHYLIDKPFDYIIGSVHLIDGKYIPEKITPHEYNDKVYQYWTLIKQMAESKKFDIVGHIDLFKRFGIKPTRDFTKEIDEALLAILDSGMAIEINTSGWSHNCKEQYPAQYILKKCKDLNIPILISSDAHKKNDLARWFKKAYSLAKKLGFSSLTSFSQRKKINQVLSDPDIKSA